MGDAELRKLLTDALPNDDEEVSLALLMDGGSAIRALLATLDERERLRQLVKDCQADLARYLPPDGGASDYEVIGQLLARLDGPQARAALIAEAKPAPAAAAIQQQAVEAERETILNERDRLREVMIRLRRLSADGPWSKNDLVSKMATIRGLCSSFAIAPEPGEGA